ncbi:C40 family peptidase [Thermohalobacter berrensis]|uniref:Glycoside hydrolase n=1 Tax=Thermohalobacter berrensis TaxID=99594 RepID=A0A419T2U8_9FIRM|nr:NlpC/P60 family protein [Thermohalobacter berrensis]RKD31782.1 glycoside hydrolase [Thermohalobacter berrensis]
MNKEYYEEEIRKILPKFKNVKFVHNGRSLDEGLDCLGFLVLFYKEFGINIPSDDGKPIERDWYKKDPERYIRAIRNFCSNEVKINELQPLDLVYFAVKRNIITHTGVMINDREFAHMAPRKGLLISRLNRPWRRRFRGAVRLIDKKL